MGKVKDWLMGMEEDATCMSLDEWISKHGEWNKTVYETVNGEEDGRIFYDLFEQEKQMTFDELTKWLGTCPDHKWKVDYAWWTDEDEDANDGNVVVRFKIESEKDQTYDNAK